MAVRRGQLSVVAFLAIAMALIAYPFVIKTPAWQNAAVIALIFAAATTGWNLLGGYMGQISFGHSVFFGFGAYTTGYLLAHQNLSPWLGILCGSAFAAGVGLVIGFPVFRLRSHYFTIATIAIQQLVFISVINSDWLGSSTGLIMPIKSESLANLRFSFRDQIGYYLLALGLFALVTAASWLYLRGPAGLYSRAIRDDDVAAQACGVLVRRYKLYTMALSAAITGMAGGVYAMYVLLVDPTVTVDISVSIVVVVMAILGGAGRFWGPLVGACVLTAFQSSTNITLGGAANGSAFIVYGVLIIAIVILEPRGLVVGVPQLVTWAAGRSSEAIMQVVRRGRSPIAKEAIDE